MDILKFSAGGAALCAASVLPAAVPGFPERDSEVLERPDIILIMTDQQTAGAMSCMGNPYLSTPNMDRLAAAGVMFTGAYCTAPLSGPSRSALFTGCYPEAAGLQRNGAPLPDSLASRTLGDLLSAAGYECAYAGKWHVGQLNLPPEGGHGFERIHGHSDIGLAEACVGFLRREHERPYFLVASFDNPHNICEWARAQNLPYGNVEKRLPEDCPPLPENHLRNEDDADVVLAERQAAYSLYPTVRYTPEDWRQYRNAYFRLVEKVDAEIGRIVDELEGLRRNTVVIFTSDHGDGAGAHQWNQKSALYEEVVNVPLVFAAYPSSGRLSPDSRAYPASKNSSIKSSRASSLVSSINFSGNSSLASPKTSSRTSFLVDKSLVSTGIDIFATICDYAGAAVPKGRPGLSLRSAVERGEPLERDFIVTETTFDKGATRGWMLRTPGYKYVLYDKGKHREQFFDMEKDRLEMHNIAGDKAFSTQLQLHRNLLSAWMKANSVRPTRQGIHDVPAGVDFNRDSRAHAFSHR